MRDGFCSRYSIWMLVLACIVVAPCAAAQKKTWQPAVHADSVKAVPSSASAADTLSPGAQIYEYIAYPTLQLLTWPVETLLVPVVRTLTYPSQQPIRYFINENVVDRMRNLVSFGDRNRYLLYPTLSVAPGTGSRTGVTFRDNAVFGRDQERLVAYLLYYVNGDYKVRTYMTASKALGTSLTGKVSAGVVRMKNTSANDPGTSHFYYYSDSSEQYQFLLQHPLFLGFNLLGDVMLRVNRLGSAPPNGQPPPDTNAFFGPSVGGLRPTRGIGQSFLDRSWSVGLGRDTRNNPNITLTGSRLDVGWRYHDIGLNHSFQEWGGQYAKYFKLGRERYEITAAEERRRGGLSMDKFLSQMEYEKIREGIFSRKVVVVHLYAAQSFEIPGNRMPVYGLQTLGNDTPLRGYQGSRFRDYTVAGASTEYRFPMLRLMDGTLFDEYGVRGRSWDEIDYLNYKNSWGFGIRVRQPDLFLFRIELGIHGFSGAVLNMSVDAPF